MKYVILPTSFKDSVNFSLVVESADTVRYNNDQSSFLVKFEGDTPDFLNVFDQYTYAEIKVILNSPAWTSEDE